MSEFPRTDMPQTTVELLVGARALIEKGWCQGSSARDATGRVTPFGGSAATSFCMSGAMCHLMGPQNGSWVKANEYLREVVGYGIALWNDQPERTKEEVLVAFDKAIALAGTPQ